METELIRRAMGGDADAFERLGRPRFDALFRIAQRILRDRHDAEDAVQQALWEAWRDIRSLRDPERFDAWLHRLVVHACYRIARQEKPHRTNVVLIHDIDRADDGDAAAAHADRDALERAFLALTPEHRAVVVLHHYAGHPLAEIASLLGVPAGTVRSRLHHAHRRLPAELDAAAVEPRRAGGAR
jgi:RNA polymerase sigma-70 factor (ECF subfamily)